MRIYNDFTQAHSETQRELKEMGIRVHPKTYQDRNVENDPGFETLELTNYSYRVLNPVKGMIPRVTQPWASAEFKERLSGAIGLPVNPGTAWELRSDVWETFKHGDGKFAYSYSERFAYCGQVARIIDRIRKDPDSRQLYISVWNPADARYLGGISRIPCTLGYQVHIRKNQLNLHYLQRSSDFATHFSNDVYLAVALQEYLANETMHPVGDFTHSLMSLHVFMKDVQNVF